MPHVPGAKKVLLSSKGKRTLASPSGLWCRLPPRHQRHLTTTRAGAAATKRNHHTRSNCKYCRCCRPAHTGPPAAPAGNGRHATRKVVGLAGLASPEIRRGSLDRQLVDPARFRTPAARRRDTSRADARRPLQNRNGTAVAQTRKSFKPSIFLMPSVSPLRKTRDGQRWQKLDARTAGRGVSALEPECQRVTLSNLTELLIRTRRR